LEGKYVIKREKRRYLALQVITDFPINKRIILENIQISISKLFGEYGNSKANIKLIKYFPEKKQIIIRCSHFMLIKVRAAIASILAFDNKPAVVHVIDISGTLKALTKKI
jgi:RNase P/RNase MRP subunit POP5